jgi:hypothetical protein
MSAQVLLFEPRPVRYPLHAAGDCAGAIVPLGAGAPEGVTHFCSTCGALLGDDPVTLARALRAQAAAGVPPEPYTSYLARMLERLRVARREAVRDRERAAGVTPPRLTGRSR